MRAQRLMTCVAVLFAVLASDTAWCDTIGSLNLNFETTAAGTTTYSTTANDVMVPGTYNYAHSVVYTPGNVAGTSYGFYDDYIFSIGSGQVDSITSTIDLAGLVGINGLQVRLFNVPDASSPGTSGYPGSSLIQAWSSSMSCGSGCTGTVAVINPQVLNAGTYDLQIRGTAESYGGSFAGVLNAAPVPLPAAFTLLLSGVGLLGAMRRRGQL